MSSKKEVETPDKPRWNVSRRGFIRGVGLGGGALGALEEEAQAEPQPAAKVLGPGPVAITLTVNGKPHKLAVEPRMTLLDALRDKLDLTGAKGTCDRGMCGSCTVVMGGKAVYACSILAVDAPVRTSRPSRACPRTIRWSPRWSTTTAPSAASAHRE